MTQQQRLYPVLIDEEHGQIREGVLPRVDVDRIREELRDIKQRLTGVFDEQDAAGGLGLASLEVSLMIGAEGGIWFISKGKIEGSIKLTFERGTRA